MTLSLTELNALPADAAAVHLRACCGSTRWVEAMVARRPYRSLEALLETADEAWQATGPAGWEDAFAHHPRIGGKTEGRKDGGTEEWSRAEQSSAETSDEEIRRALAEGNAEYERRFGRIYIVCATGRTADDLLADLRARLGNDPKQERGRAAAEQRKITRIRLRKLVGEGN